VVVGQRSGSRAKGCLAALALAVAVPFALMVRWAAFLFAEFISLD
jgi:hypothetical protein